MYNSLRPVLGNKYEDYYRVRGREHNMYEHNTSEIATVAMNRGQTNLSSVSNTMPGKQPVGVFSQSANNTGIVNKIPTIQENLGDGDYSKQKQQITPQPNLNLNNNIETTNISNDNLVESTNKVNVIVED